MKLFWEKKSHLILSIIGFLLLFITVYAVAPINSESAEIKSSKLVKLEPRPAVKLEFILIKPDNPVAAVILLEGGMGILKLGSVSGKPKVGWGNGFLTRTRDKFAKSGLMVALVDKPSDRQKVFPRFRISSEHAQDLKAVIAQLKSEADVPIWLVGMSLGTFSAPNGAIRLKEEVDGLVLVSSVTLYKKKYKEFYKTHPNGILNMDLDQITVPTLIVHHRDDKCWGSPPSGAQKVKETLQNSNQAEIMYFSGGKRPDSGKLGKPCKPLSAHGYYGIEGEVVSAIANFIKGNSK